MKKDWPKRPSDHQLQETRKKTDRAMTPATEAVRVLPHFAPLGFLQDEKLHNLHAQSSLGQNCHRPKKKKEKKNHLGSMHTWSLQSDSMQPCRLWPARLLCQERVFSRQEYWSVLVNTGCHTLLDHYISCCPSRQPP